MASEGGGSLVVDVYWSFGSKVKLGGCIMRTSIIMYVWSIALLGLGK